MEDLSGDRPAWVGRSGKKESKDYEEYLVVKMPLYSILRSRSPLNSYGSVRSIGFAIFCLYIIYSTQIHLYLHFPNGYQSLLLDNTLK